MKARHEFGEKGQWNHWWIEPVSGFATEPGLQLTPMSPDAPSSTLRDTDGGGIMGGGTRDDRYENAQNHGGGVVWTPDMVAHVEEQNRRHKAWLATEEGAAWFAAQPWNAHLPLARVRKLGLQQHPNGTSIMLYNTVSGYVLDGSDRTGCTVTLASLVKQGYRIQVEK